MISTICSSAQVSVAESDEPSPSQHPSVYGGIRRSASGSASAAAHGTAWFSRSSLAQRKEAAISCVVTVPEAGARRQELTDRLT